ncbi:MAG: hypothetical protein DRH11_12235 [Deltaproteobacteria bacterium]|nr:MAG: hypothetical protein DRH11_12235 [Deltaproteobacteria bacterium]
MTKACGPDWKRASGKVKNTLLNNIWNRKNNIWFPKVSAAFGLGHIITFNLGGNFQAFALGQAGAILDFMNQSDAIDSH